MFHGNVKNNSSEIVKSVSETLKLLEPSRNQQYSYHYIQRLDESPCLTTSEDIVYAST